MPRLTLPEIQNRLQALGLPVPDDAAQRALLRVGALPSNNSEIGRRPTPENQVKYLYRQMYVDTGLRDAILDIRQMDRLDPRVKRIHEKTARQTVKGGLRLCGGTGTRIQQDWDKFQRRLGLNRREKLESDARGLFMEGNLPMQWVLDGDNRVVAGVRMPSESIVPNVGTNGQFLDVVKAYQQFDLMTGATLTTFALFQLSMVRLSPDNYDDYGSLGRPYLDASRTIWKKLTMTEEDLVIRRRTRAPQKLAHILKNVDTEFYEKYQAMVTQQSGDIATDFFVKGDGDVKGIVGDASLDQIADVVHLLDTFFSGAPAPKGIFGYNDGLSRDILEDIKRDFFDELDALQDTQVHVYYLGFCLDLLLQGVDPDNFDFSIEFAERRTETPTQATDRALKQQALGASRETVFETAGLDPATEQDRLDQQKANGDPYPPDPSLRPTAGTPRVSITPNNARKNESATTINNG